MLELLVPSIFQEKRVAEGNPSFDVAINTRQLAGPTTYCVKELPNYAAAYIKVAWDESDGPKVRCVPGDSRRAQQAHPST